MLKRRPIVEGVNVYPVESLSEAAAFLNSEKEIAAEPHALGTDTQTAHPENAHRLT